MIDIHAHVIPLVDDGSKSLNRSLEMIKQAVAEGVTDIVLTPHLNSEYKLTVEELKNSFDAFKKEVLATGVKINLYLGQEILVVGDVKKLLEKTSVLALNNSEYVLIEFKLNEDFDIAEAVYQFKKAGYKPIIAHFERYDYADLSVAEEVKSLGGFIQINSDSLVGKGKCCYLKKVKQLFKEGFVDFVSSDIHEFRKFSLKKAEEYVAKKFGENVKNAVFIDNAKEIIKG